MFIKKCEELNSIKDVVLKNTGMSEEEFLNPPSDIHIEKIDEAIKIIKAAIGNNEHITIVGDYDCDGICASAILKSAFSYLNADFSIRLPKRFSEGYGLSEKIVDEINDGLLITVDNGIAAIDAIKKAKSKGLKVIVTDHHLPVESCELPEADVIIDPNAILKSSSFQHYCGAGLAYKLVCELIDDEKVKTKSLVFAAIATIADVVPLIGDNRNIVINGLKILNSDLSKISTGLYALLDVFDLSFSPIDEKTIGFKIGPAINAPGRMEDNGAEFALNVISYEGNILNAKDYAKKLFVYNENRKALKDKSLELLKKNIEENNLKNEKPLIIYQKELHEGLVGLLAGSLAEEYKTPCFILTDSEDPAIIKGSARGYGEAHIKNSLDSISDILENYGGHKSAAGLSLKKENFEEFKNKIQHMILSEDTSDDILYDLEISEKDIPKVIKELSNFAPFGEGNPQVVFLVNDYQLIPRMGKFYDFLGKNQSFLKLFSNCNAISFNCADKFIKDGYPKKMKLIGTISQNYFKNRAYPQVEFTDFCEIKEKKVNTNLQDLLIKKARKEK